jgi:hypothetical protein
MTWARRPGQLSATFGSCRHTRRPGLPREIPRELAGAPGKGLALARPMNRSALSVFGSRHAIALFALPAAAGCGSSPGGTRSDLKDASAEGCPVGSICGRDAASTDGGSQDVVADESHRAAPDGSRDASLAPQDGGAPCPSMLPTDGTACSTDQLACEYGTDPALECDTVVTCSAGAWTTTQTPFTGGFCATTSAPACPASVVDVSQKSSCGGAFFECDYPTARCECGCPEGNPGGDCSTDASGGPRIWQCDTSSGTLPDCPAARPRLGAPCSQENESCSYAGKDQLACWGDTVECKGGVWTNAGGAGC